MQLSKPVKVLVGLGTLWVSFYPLLFFAVWLVMAIGGLTMMESNSEQPFFMYPFFAIFPLHCLTILIQYGLFAFYLVHVIKNSKAADTVRIILGVGCFFVPFIAMPAYFYIYIWRETPPAWAIQPQITPTIENQT